MRRASSAACRLLLLLAAGCSASVEPTAGERASIATPAAAQIEFVHEYRRGLSKARELGRPMLLFFTAAWCDHCHAMVEQTLSQGEVVELSRRFICVLVDADAEPEVCRDFNVRAFPTIQFLSPRGVPLNRIVGRRAVPQLTLDMQAALEAVARRAEPEPRVLR